MTSLPPASDSPNLADIRAKFAASWDAGAQAAQAAEASRTTPPKVEQVACPAPPGFTVWRIKGTQGRTMMPALVAHAPVRIRNGYLARVIGNLTGVCPICQGVAWIDADAPDPETHPAGWRHLEISFGVNHSPGCSATFDDSMRKWFDPRSVQQQAGEQ